MKKVTKRLLISVMVLIAAVSLATATTYAWFTMNDTPEVNGFDVNVTAVDGLYITAVGLGDADPSTVTKGEPGTFKSYVTAEEVIANILAYNNGQYAQNATTLKTLTHGTVDSGAITTPAGFKQPAADETNHYTFRLFFRSNNNYNVLMKYTQSGSEGSYVYTADSTVTSVRYDTDPETEGIQGIPFAKAWADGLTYDYNGTEDVEYNLGDDLVAAAKDAVRIAFRDASTTSYWDPNPNSGFTNNTDNNVAVDYYNFKNGTTITSGTIVTNNVDHEKVLTTLTGSDAAGYEGYLDISIWIEGWDANAFESILRDIITTSLVFQGVVA